MHVARSRWEKIRLPRYVSFAVLRRCSGEIAGDACLPLLQNKDQQSPGERRWVGCTGVSPGEARENVNVSGSSCILFRCVRALDCVSCINGAGIYRPSYAPDATQRNKYLLQIKKLTIARAENTKHDSLVLLGNMRSNYEANYVMKYLNKELTCLMPNT